MSSTVISPGLTPMAPPGRVQPLSAEKQLFYQELAYIAQELGYRPGVAFFRFQEKFKGEKPPYHWRNLSPLPPRPETRAWYRVAADRLCEGPAKGRLQRRAG